MLYTVRLQIRVTSISDFPSSDQHISQDQVALLYKALFTSPPPSLTFSFDWKHIILVLLTAVRDSSSPLSRQIFHDVIHQHIPSWIRSHKSTSLLYGIGNDVRSWAFMYPEPAIKLFIRLDKLMVEFRREPEDIEGLEEESVESWRHLRTDFVEGLSNPNVPEQLRLPTGYFDSLVGHGPLPSLI